ncbi:MAG: carboxypeptidase-like regulatory domain-containing protein [Acidobacteriota bacterium]
MKLALKVWTLVAIGIFFYTNVSDAQASAAVGSIRGVIKDAQGSPLVGASVMVMSETEQAKAKIVKQVSTDKEGLFLAANILPGRYRIKALAAGFAPFVFAADVLPRKVIVFDSILMRRTGTLAEQTSLNANSTAATRRARGSIFHLEEVKPKVVEDDSVVLTPRSTELHGYVNAFNQTATREESSFGSMVGANFALSQQLTERTDMVMHGQVAHGDGAMQRFEVLTTTNASDKHRLSLALGYARFTFSRQNAIPKVGQFSLSARDTWQVAGPVLVVYGLEFARFTEGANATSVLPRLGVAVDAGARTRVFAGLEPGASVDEQSSINLESGEIVFSQPKTVAFSKHNRPLTDSSYRLQVGAEHILNDKSSVEMMAFFDTVSGHGVGLLAIPVDGIENADATITTAEQKGRARGLRVVYNRKLSRVIDSSFGYAFGEGQQMDARGITTPSQIFSNATFQVFSARVNANFLKTGTRVSTILRIAPQQAIFGIDPFQGQIATFDPNISISLSQALPNFGILPGHWELMADLRNLLDQQASITDDNQQLIASRYGRLVRVGVSMRF